MIRKFIDKLLGKSPPAAAKGVRIPLGKRVEVAAAEHGIDPELLDERASRISRPNAQRQVSFTTWRNAFSLASIFSRTSCIAPMIRCTLTL